MKDIADERALRAVASRGAEARVRVEHRHPDRRSTAGPSGRSTIYATEPDAFGEAEVTLLDRARRRPRLRHRGAPHARRAGSGRRPSSARSTRSSSGASPRRPPSSMPRASGRRDVGARIQQMLLLDEPPDDVRGPADRRAHRSLAAHRGRLLRLLRHEASDCLDVFVADVMGKGIPAALLARGHEEPLPRGALAPHGRTAKGRAPGAQGDRDPRAHPHRASSSSTIESFVTLCYARFDVASGRLHLVDCGHTGVLHLRGSDGRLRDPARRQPTARGPRGRDLRSDLDRHRARRSGRALLRRRHRGARRARRPVRRRSPRRVRGEARRRSSPTRSWRPCTTRPSRSPGSGPSPTTSRASSSKVLDEERPLARAALDIGSELRRAPPGPRLRGRLLPRPARRSARRRRRRVPRARGRRGGEQRHEARLPRTGRPAHRARRPRPSGTA